MRDTVLFDINETTLDLEPLRPRFASAFKSEIALAEWFGRLLQASTVCALTGVKTSFRDLAAAGLDRSAALFGVSLAAEAKDELLTGFSDLQAHPDVIPALRELRRSGRRTVAFSNSSSSLLARQIEGAGLEAHFDALISVEEVGSFKPDARVYRYATEKMDRPPDEVRLVAAHDWDVHGALSAGLLGAFIARSSIPYHPAYRRPTVEARSMSEVVAKILAEDGSV